MIRDKSNIVLVGMPGSGKSTVGVILAKMTSRGFIDTDVIIQTSQCRSLQDIVDREGHMALRQIEEDALLSLRCFNQVIATGGSAVYSNAAMEYLRSQGVIIFLDVNLAVLESRIHSFHTRGLAKREGQSLADLFEERVNLYRTYADITIECGDLNQEEVSSKIIMACGSDGL
jgi:shikimate kinase